MVAWVVQSDLEQARSAAVLQARLKLKTHNCTSGGVAGCTDRDIRRGASLKLSGWTTYILVDFSVWPIFFPNKHPF